MTNVRSVTVRCNSCGSSTTGSESVNTDRAWEAAKARGWHRGKNRARHICPDCWKRGER